MSDLLRNLRSFVPFSSCHRISFGLVVAQVLFLCLAGSSVLGQSKGIKFLSYDLPSAQKVAKRTNTFLFVEIMLTGCPHCAEMEPVLQSEKVGRFFNSKFLSLKFEANSEQSVILQKQYGITYPEFPLFLFFDPEGNFVHVAMGLTGGAFSETEDKLMRAASDALSWEGRATNYRKRYNEGARTASFLVDYGRYSRTVKDSADLKNVQAGFEEILRGNKERESTLGLYVLQRFVDRYDSPLAQYFFANTDRYLSVYSKKEVMDAAESIIYHSLYGSGTGHYTLAAIQRMRASMIRLGVSGADAFSRTVYKELEACFAASDAGAAGNVFSEYIRTNPKVSIEDFVYTMKLFRESARDFSFLGHLPDWIAYARKVAGNGKLLPEIYLAGSRIYHSAGKDADALDLARKAVSEAKALGADSAEYQANLKELDKK